MLRVQGRETQALLALRNWVLVPMTTLCWLSHIVLATQANPPASRAGLACLAAASVAFVVALACIRKPWVLWVSLTGLVLLGLPCVASSDGGAWLFPRFIIGQAGYILITMLSRGWGLVAALTTPLLLRALWALEPAAMFPDGFTIAAGMIPILQLLGSNILAWWVWHGLIKQSVAADEQLRELREAELIALADGERSSLWRASTRRVHESVLNSINALIVVRSISQQAATEWAARARAAVDLGEAPDPDGRPMPRRAPEGFFDGAQALVASGMAGLLFAGTFYVFFIHTASPARDLVSRILVVAGSAIAIVVVLRRQRVAPLQATLLALVPSAIPWVLAPAAADCSQMATLASALGIAGYAISIIALCGGLVPFLVAIPIWGAGAFLLSSFAPVACQRSPVAMMFNTLSIIPLILIAAYFGMRSHRASAARMDEARARAALAIGRAEALRLVDRQLSNSVERAAELLAEVGECGHLRQEQERLLTCQAALLRAGISVDSERDGAFTLAAYALVHALATDGIPIRVVVLAGSLDRRPLPAGLLPSLVEAVRCHRLQLDEWDATIACVHGQSTDIISVTVPWEVAQHWWSRLATLHDGLAMRNGEAVIGSVRVAVHMTEEAASHATPLGLVTIEREVLAETALQTRQLASVP